MCVTHRVPVCVCGTLCVCDCTRTVTHMYTVTVQSYSSNLSPSAFRHHLLLCVLLKMCGSLLPASTCSMYVWVFVCLGGLRTCHSYWKCAVVFGPATPIGNVLWSSDPPLLLEMCCGLRTRHSYWKCAVVFGPATPIGNVLWSSDLPLLLEMCCGLRTRHSYCALWSSDPPLLL